MIAAARQCLGVRFRLQGRNPATGLDCIGLMLWSASAAGLSIADQNDYVLHDDPGRLDAALAASPFIRAGTGAPQAGDIARFEHAGLALHLGIITPATLIHADARLRRVVEHRLDDDWYRRLVSLWRYPEA